MNLWGEQINELCALTSSKHPSITFYVRIIHNDEIELMYTVVVSIWGKKIATNDAETAGTDAGNMWLV